MIDTPNDNDNDNDNGNRDPLRAAFDDHQRAQPDVVPRNVEHSVDDLRRLADGAVQVQVTHYEMNESGVTRHTEWATVTQPITTKRGENR
jgi:hypothetical protein